MSQTSAGHPLDNNDPADLPRCPMEALADRFDTTPWPSRMGGWAYRLSTGEVRLKIDAELSKPEQLDDLIAFLQEVRG